MIIMNLKGEHGMNIFLTDMCRFWILENKQ
jgi:hypothetical protein